MSLVGNIEQFPFSSARIVTVPSVLGPKFKLEYIGQLNSYHVPSLVVTVPVIAPDLVNPHLAFDAASAIRVDPFVLPCRSPTDNSGQPVEVNGTLNRCAFWLTEARGTSLSDIDFEIRAVVGRCTPEVVAFGTIKLLNFQQKGLICQVNGILCTQFELWLRVPPGPGAAPMTIGLDIAADRFNGEGYDIIKGAIAT